MHFTLPDSECTARPMNKYCSFMGGDPRGFLRRTWLTLNPDFEFSVHNDSDCASFVHDFSHRSSSPEVRTGASADFTMRSNQLHLNVSSIASIVPVAGRESE